MSSFLFMRSLARFFGSLFFPFFRVWGESEIRTDRGCVYIVRDYNLLTWLSALRIFRNPFKFVSYDNTSLWFRLAEACGLKPIKLSGKTDQDFINIEHWIDQRETLLLMIPEFPEQNILELTAKLKSTPHLKTLFMAISGAKLALKAGSMIPKACPVSVFCGMPHFHGINSQNPLCELDFLEMAITDIPLNELPSIFFNHSRNS